MAKDTKLYHTKLFSCVGTNLPSTYTANSKISFCTGQAEDSLITSIIISNLESADKVISIYLNNTAQDFLLSKVTVTANTSINLLTNNNFLFKYLDANGNYMLALPFNFSLMISVSSTLSTGFDIVTLREDF